MSDESTNKPPKRSDVTVLLSQARQGDSEALEAVMPVVYEELRAIARRQIHHRSADQTLNTTALVHEAFLKLSRSASPAFEDRCHFFAVAAVAMRQILVDYARRRSAEKRGGGWKRVDLDAENLDLASESELVLDIDDALHKLTDLNPRLTQVVECRFFAGMNEEETALALGVTDRTVRRDWVKARAWLHAELGVV